jgi:hypothetical protein
MSFKKVGDWGKVTFLIGQLEEELTRAQLLSLKRFGLKVEAVAKTHISRQDLKWEALKPVYLARKVKQGMSENTLVATSSYFNSITSFVMLDSVYAGVRKEAKNKTGQNLADIAAVHEYGSKSGNIPARPLWKPTFQEVIIWHIKNNTPETIFITNIQKYL